MPWIQIHVRTSKEQAPRAEELLEAAGALSVTVQDAADQPLLEPAPGETPVWDQVQVTGLFDESFHTQSIGRRLETAFHNHGAVTLEQLEDRTWERVWLDHFHPMPFGERLWICPDGQAPETFLEDTVILRLDPGLAFGTGTHPTTALCLEWLANADLQGRDVIDFGCGSGVLAIAALLLGARKVTAIDHDPQALTATLENAVKNRVADRLTIAGSDTPAAAPADIVVANILAGTLIDLAEPITDCLKSTGRLVLSGILNDQAETVASAYRSKVALEEPVGKDGWVLLQGPKTRI